MKPHSLRPGVLALLLASSVIPLALAQERNHTNPNVAKIRSLWIVRGEATFLERIALPPDAMLHVSLVGRVAGAEYLPLATMIVPAKNGATAFQLPLNRAALPSGPYRLQAWIVANNRALFVGREGQTVVNNLESTINIPLKMAPAPHNIDGSLDRMPVVSATQKMMLRGTVNKLDRRGLAPDSRIEIQLRELSPTGTPANMVIGQAIQLEGKQLPKSFAIELMPGDLKSDRRYAVVAKVIENGKTTYATGAPTEVTTENLAQAFALRVVAVSALP